MIGWLWESWSALVTRYLAWWHGRGAPHQLDYYRCDGCHGLVTHARIRRGGCCPGRYVRTARLRLREELRLLLLPWTVR